MMNLLTVVLVTVLGSGQEATPQPSPPASLTTIAVIGASASAGWGAMLSASPTHRAAAINLGDVLTCSMLSEDSVHSWATASFFTNPVHFGSSQVDAALAADATLVIGIDYLFWYTYGAIAWTSTTPPTPQERLTALQKGLTQLERFDVPVIVGNLPNMSGAAGRILSQSQIPDSETLSTLNHHIQKWAAEHDRVHLFDLATIVETLMAGEPFLLEGHAYGEAGESPLILPDQLHPTGEGLVAIGRSLNASIDTALTEVSKEDIESAHDAIVACLLESHAPLRRPQPPASDVPPSH